MKNLFHINQVDMFYDDNDFTTFIDTICCEMSDDLEICFYGNNSAVITEDIDTFIQTIAERTDVRPYEQTGNTAIYALSEDFEDLFFIVTSI